MSRRSGGAPPGLTAGLLSPLAPSMERSRHGGWRGRAARAGIPVICIGNLTLGGAGKTPAAIAVAQILRRPGAGRSC